MIDLYFKRPILWDYVLAVIVGIILVVVCNRQLISIPSDEHLYSIVSDLSTISLTLAGFILTLLTVLISAKSTSKTKEKLSNDDTLYEMFFSTDLYFQTVKHLKNAIISLTIIAVFGFILKLSSTVENYEILFIYNSLGLVVIFLTVWRCLLILTKIIKIQQES